MDIGKLFDAIIENENIKNIPLNHIFAVFYAIISAINEGKCYYDDAERSTYV